jgi:hypothetical protein
VTLPWVENPFSAVFQLARILPDPALGQPGFRLTLESDRLLLEETTALLECCDVVREK